MKKAILVTLAGLLACPCVLGDYGQEKTKAAAQETSTTEQLPSVDQILTRYVQALGGKAAIEKLTGLSLTGTIEVQAAGLSGKAELLARAPNKYVLKVEFGGIGAFTEAYDGTAGWSQDPINGLRDIRGVELAQLKRSADIHRELHLKDVYKALAVKGKEKVGSSDTYVIEATPPEGGSEKMYFDTQSGLLLRTDSVSRGPQGEIPTEVYLEEYKEINGLKIPVTLRQVTSVLTSTIKFTDLKANVDVDQNRFSKPGSQ